MCKNDIEAYYKITYDIMAILYCYYYPSMQRFMLCKCVFSGKKFHTNAAFMVFMYNSNMSTKWEGSFKNVLLQRSHLETMSGSNEFDKLFKQYVIISLILMCNTVTIPC